MTIQNNHIFAQASVIIKSLYGEKAEFREGQYEAIEATMTKHRRQEIFSTANECM